MCVWKQKIILSGEKSLTTMVEELLTALSQQDHIELILISELELATANCLSTLISAAVTTQKTVRVIAVNTPSINNTCVLQCGSPGQRFLLWNPHTRKSNLATTTTTKKNGEQWIKEGIIDHMITNFPPALTP